MMERTELYRAQIESLYASAIPQLADIKPSAWTEENVIMQKPFPGPFRYDRTPYTREIIDCLAPDHPARWVAVMKGAQVGFSSGVIMPGCGWLIANNPGNTIVTVGNPDLVEKAMEKLDLLIDGSGLRNLIKPQVVRNRANKSGDTNNKKEFSGGYITITSAGNHKAIRQIDLQYGFFDDFESVKSASKESGSTRKLLEQRFAAYADTHKIFYISTPELKQTSNIEPAYLLGDRRKYLVPCPCCGEYIELRWSITEDNVTAGITWKVDAGGHLEHGSVGYICQKCGGFFTDSNKQDLLNAGFWEPTCAPSKEGYYSYHLSSLYAPIGMFDWKHYVHNYIEAHPAGQPRKEAEYKSFVNLCLGETYEPANEAPKANSIQKNIRRYEIRQIPQRMSQNDGNGKIVLLTCSADMNGKIDDARLDFEILAWSESGSSYSILQGSIGSFVPRENAKKIKEDRVKWTYEFNKPNSIWPAFNDLLGTKFTSDTGMSMQIFMSGLDCGHFTNFAYSFIDSTPFNVVGLKGDKEDRYVRFGIDVPIFKHARERAKLYILQVGLIKDDISDYMQLRWSDSDDRQPPNFMNYPTPAEGMYGYSSFFEHYESEHRVIETNPDGNGVAAKWEKKTSISQNHFWDCRVYNHALREIVVDFYGKSAKVKNPTWKDFATAMATIIK